MHAHHLVLPQSHQTGHRQTEKGDAILMQVKLTMQLLAVCAVAILGTDWVTVRSILNLSTHATSRVLYFEVLVCVDQLVRHFPVPL